MPTEPRLESIARAVASVGLAVTGAFHPKPDEDIPGNPGTVILLGPQGPAMWDVFQASAEYHDGACDPLDRWSRRVIGGLAAELGAWAYFPFGTPPWLPFQDWAMRGEGAGVSPVGMLASPGRGLWASYRGALGVGTVLGLDPPGPVPCRACDAPCRRACPVGALGPDGYDIAACIAHLGEDKGRECRNGCLVRRSCPAGRGLNLPSAQCRFHMAAFYANHGGKGLWKDG